MNKNILKIFILIIILFILSFLVYKNFMINFKNFTSESKKLTGYKLYSENAKQKPIFLYLGAEDKEGFKLYETRIYENENLINEIKQVILKLLEKPQKGYISFIPEGTFLREAYLDSNNICYLDFSEEITLNHKGGTEGEYLTIYSIVNTVFHNFNTVRGVKILINGKEAETLAGHIDISEILFPSAELIK